MAQVKAAISKLLRPERVLVGLGKVAGHAMMQGCWVPFAAATTRCACPLPAQLRDKVTFCLGIMHMLLSAYWLGYSPQ
jgi:hypothetical protein